MGKNKNKKTKLLPFSPENVEIVNAKKLQEKESKTQNNSRGGGTSGTARKSGKPQGIKENTQNITSSATTQEASNTDESTTADPHEVNKETTVSAVKEGNKLEDNSDIKSQITEKVADVDPEVSELINNFPNINKDLEETSDNIPPNIEGQTVDTHEVKNIEESNTAPSNIKLSKKDMQKVNPDNPAWIRGSSSPQSMGHPFSSLNPNAMEFTPGGHSDEPNYQPTQTYPTTSEMKTAPLPQPVISPITDVPVLAQNFQGTNWNRHEPPQEVPSDMSVESIPVRSNEPVLPSQKNATNAWHTDEIKDDQYLKCEEKGKTHVENNWEENSWDLPQDISGTENVQLDNQSSKNTSDIWSSQELAEPPYSTGNQRQGRPSYSENQHGYYGKNDRSQNYRGNKFGDGRNERRDGARRHYSDKEHHNDRYKNSERGGFHRGGNNRRNDDNYQNPEENSRFPEQGSKGRNSDHSTWGRTSNTHDESYNNSSNRGYDYKKPYQSGQNFGKRHDSSYNDRRRRSREDAEYSSTPPNQTEEGGNWRERRTEEIPRGRFDRNKNDRFDNRTPRDNDSNYGKRRDNRRGRDAPRERGRYQSDRNYHNRDNSTYENKRSFNEPTEMTSPGKDSCDNYHKTDEYSNDVHEENFGKTGNRNNVSQNAGKTLESSNISQETEKSFGNWVDSVDELTPLNSQEVSTDKVAIENVPKEKEAHNVPKIPPVVREERNKFASEYETPEQKPYNVSKIPPHVREEKHKFTSEYETPEQKPYVPKIPPHIREERNKFTSESETSEQNEKPRRSWETSKRRDPRMENERLNKSIDSSRMGSDYSASSSGGTRSSEKRFTRFSDQDADKGKFDQDFERWEKIWEKINKFRVVREIQGDLFQQPKDYSLAHCVAEDLRMGSGIAVDFKREFKNLPDLLDQRAKQGGLATLHDEQNNRYVYYLVTKRESTGKPTYMTLWRSLNKMKDHVKKHEVKKLAIPRLACGLDRLEWNKVKSMIEHIFHDLELDITVCNFQQEEEVPKKSVTCKLVVEAYPITKISSGTLILYFSTENGDLDENTQEMSKKFNFQRNFNNHKPKKLGDVVYSEDGNYGMLGCIVRKTNRDKMNFTSLSKCAQEINKKNRSFGRDAFEYVAFQWVKDADYKDDLINEKIITVLINFLRNVHVYVCTGGFEENGEWGPGGETYSSLFRYCGKSGRKKLALGRKMYWQNG